METSRIRAACKYGDAANIVFTVRIEYIANQVDGGESSKMGLSMLVGYVDITVTKQDISSSKLGL